MNKFKRNELARAISLSLTGTAIAALTVTPAIAQEGAALEEIIVSAQKRDESLQDIAVSVQVLDNQQLENLKQQAEQFKYELQKRGEQLQAKSEQLKDFQIVRCWKNTRNKSIYS